MLPRFYQDLIQVTLHFVTSFIVYNFIQKFTQKPYIKYLIKMIQNNDVSSYYIWSWSHCYYKLQFGRFQRPVLLNCAEKDNEPEKRFSRMLSVWSGLHACTRLPWCSGHRSRCLDDARGMVHPRDSFPRREERSTGPGILSWILSFIPGSRSSLIFFTG